mgnify:CR=1 FL=1
MTNDLFQENISVPADKTPAPSDVLQQELLTVKEALQKAEKSRDEYRSKYLQFKAIFQKQTHAFYLYQHLTDQSKEELSGIFKGKNFEAFLACGVQPANIDALWEYARQAALAGSLEDVELLNQIIAYTISQTMHRSSAFKMFRSEMLSMSTGTSAHKTANRQERSARSF